MDAVLVRTTIATLTAFAGGLLGVVLGRLAPGRLNVLVYAATGALLSVTVCDVLPEAKSALSWPVFLIAALSGYLLLWLIGKQVYHVCPACAISAFDETTTRRLRQTVFLLMVALGFHCTMDGLAVVVGDRMVGYANLGLLFAISIHKLPEGMALALLLLGAGFTRSAALRWTIAIEATTELGALVGILALRGAPMPVLAALFAHVGGGFFYIILNAFSAFANHNDATSARRIASVSGAAFAVTSCLLWIVASYHR